MAIIPKITGSISMMASMYIIFDVARDKKKRTSSTYSRLMLSLSLVDILGSFAMMMGTVAVPVESGYLYARGNDTTCTIQGLMVQFVVASPYYNLSLSIYYLLVLKYQWTDRRIKRIEPLLHGVPMMFLIVTTMVALALDAYVPRTFWCHITEESGY